MLVMMLNEPVFEIDRNSLEGVGAEVWRKLVCGSTNWAWVPGNVQFRSYSGAASMLHQSGNILDIATATCSRSNCAVGFCKPASRSLANERRLSDGQLAQSWSYRGRRGVRLQWLVHDCQVPHC